MKLRQICYDCQGRFECVKAGEDNWLDCRGKSYFKDPYYNPKLMKELMKKSVEV